MDMLTTMPKSLMQIITIYGKQLIAPPATAWQLQVVATTTGNLQPSTGGNVQQFSDVAKATTNSVLLCYPSPAIKPGVQLTDQAGRKYSVIELNDWSQAGNYYACALRDS